MPLDVWGHAQRELQSIVSTLSYDRIGYGTLNRSVYTQGWSSPSFDRKRPISTMVHDLYLVLKELGVLEDLKDRIQLKKRLILVGHSFGGIVAKAFSDQYNVPLAGLILLDIPPRALIQSTPKLMDMYTLRLPRIFSIAASLADIGILRIAQRFGVTLFQVTDLMKSRLTADEIDSIREFSIDGKSMRSAEAELRGFVEYIQQAPSERDAKSFRVSVIAAEAVQPIMGESNDGTWKEKWMDAQKQLSSSFPKGELIVDTECESMSLCVSTRITTAVKRMIES